MNRRTFLKALAAVGGTSVVGWQRVMASRELLGGQGFATASRYPLPLASNHPVKTIGCLMMENRSYDHYLGWYPGGDGLLDSNGILVPPSAPTSAGSAPSGRPSASRPC